MCLVRGMREKWIDTFLALSVASEHFTLDVFACARAQRDFVRVWAENTTVELPYGMEDAEPCDAQFPLNGVYLRTSNRGGIGWHQHWQLKLAARGELFEDNGVFCDAKRWAERPSRFEAMLGRMTTDLADALNCRNVQPEVVAWLQNNVYWDSIKAVRASLIPEPQSQPEMLSMNHLLFPWGRSWSEEAENQSFQEVKLAEWLQQQRVKYSQFLF